MDDFQNVFNDSFPLCSRYKGAISKIDSTEKLDSLGNSSKAIVTGIKNLVLGN
jgi:hypothetical protein